MQPKLHDKIVPLADHEDVGDLESYDFPKESMPNVRVVLTAKAWIDRDLACFFADRELGHRFVLLFKVYQTYMPALGGDMREAEIGALYELSVFVSHSFRPVVDRVERIDVRPRRR